MKKLTVLYVIIAAALIAAPAASHAADTTNSAATAASPAKKRALPFHGKVTIVDTNAMSVTLATLTLNVTSETKIAKNGKPATLSDIMVGDVVRGSYKKNEAGKATAVMLYAVEKAEGKKKKAD